MYVTAYNTTDSPVVIDDQGRTIGGHEWGTVSTTAPAAEGAVAGGRLRLVTTFPEGVSLAPEAEQAYAATQDIASRAERLGRLDRDDLAELAADAGLIPDRENPPYKAELISILAPALAVELPSETPEEPPPVTDPDAPSEPVGAAGEEEASAPRTRRRSSATS